MDQHLSPLRCYSAPGMASRKMRERERVNMVSPAIRAWRPRVETRGFQKKEVEENTDKCGPFSNECSLIQRNISTQNNYVIQIHADVTCAYAASRHMYACKSIYIYIHIIYIHSCHLGNYRYPLAEAIYSVRICDPCPMSFSQFTPALPTASTSQRQPVFCWLVRCFPPWTFPRKLTCI